MPGYVYAIGIEGTALVKIGHARDVAKRLAALQSGLPYRLVVLHQEHVDEPRRVERALHDILRVVRERGEWFELPEIYYPSLFAQGIVSAEKQDGPMPSDLYALGRRIAAARAWHDISQKELAMYADVEQATIARLEKGRQKRPRRSTIASIAEALHVPLAALLNDDTHNPIEFLSVLERIPSMALRPQPPPAPRPRRLKGAAAAHS